MSIPEKILYIVVVTAVKENAMIRLSFLGGREQGGQDNLNNAHLVEIKKVAKNQQICSWYMERRKNIGGMRNVSLNNKKAFKFRATLLIHTNVVL